MDTKQFKEFAPIGSSSSDFWRTFSDAVAHTKTLHIHDVIFGGINFVSASALKTSMPVKLRVFQDYYLKQHAETRNNYFNAQYAKCKMDKTRIYKLNQFPDAVIDNPTMVQVLASREKVFLPNAIAHQILQNTDFKVTNPNAGTRAAARAMFQRHIGYQNITQYSSVDNDAVPPVTLEDAVHASITNVIRFDEYDDIISRNYDLKFKHQQLPQDCTLEDIMTRMSTSTVSTVSSMYNDQIKAYDADIKRAEIKESIIINFLRIGYPIILSLECHTLMSSQSYHAVIPALTKHFSTEGNGASTNDLRNSITSLNMKSFSTIKELELALADAINKYQQCKEIVGDRPPESRIPKETTDTWWAANDTEFQTKIHQDAIRYFTYDNLLEASDQWFTDTPFHVEAARLKSKLRMTNQPVNIIALLKELQSMVDVGAIKHNVKKSKSLSFNNLTAKRLRGGAGGKFDQSDKENHIEIPRLKSRPLFPTNHKSDCNYHGPEAGHSTLSCKCITTKWAVPSDAYPNCFVSANTGEPTKAMQAYIDKGQRPKVEGKQSKGKGSKRLVEEISDTPKCKWCATNRPGAHEKTMVHKEKNCKHKSGEIKVEPIDNTTNDRKRVRVLNARIEALETQLGMKQLVVPDDSDEE